MNIAPQNILLSIAPYLIALFTCVGIGGAAVANAGVRKDSRLFAALVFTETAHIICFLFELISPSLDSKLFWDGVQWVITLAIAFHTLSFSRAYIKTEKKHDTTFIAVTIATVIFGGALIAGFVFLKIDPSLHSVDASVPFGELEYPFSPIMIAAFCFIFTVLGISIARVIIYIFKSRDSFRRGAWFITVGLLTSILGSSLALFGVGMFGHRNSLPLWFAAGNIIIAYGLFNENHFGFITVARRSVMDTMMDPVFVLTANDIIADCNIAACSLVGRKKDSLIGSSARMHFAKWPGAANAALDFPEAETEMDIDTDTRLRSYRISVVSGKYSIRKKSWKVVVFNEITGVKMLTQELSGINETLEAKVRERTLLLQDEIVRRSDAEEKLREMNKEISKTQREVLLTLSEVVESRSKETAHHVTRVAEFAKILAHAYGLSAEEVEMVGAAAPMHDVGKISIPDSILCKPGILTPDERETMKHHTVVGYEILRSSENPLFRAAAVIALEHHERWDGKGYPLGKSGKTIALTGRIVAICDVFDALAFKRSYKPAWPMEKVLEQFKLDRGTAFDPELIDLLFANMEKFMDIKKTYQEPEDIPFFEPTA